MDELTKQEWFIYLPINTSLYKCENSKIKVYFIKKVEFTYIVNEFSKVQSSLAYILDNGEKIYKGDINKTYFTSKKELTHYLVDQLYG